jgi:hypothetical protein
VGGRRRKAARYLGCAEQWAVQREVQAHVRRLRQQMQRVESKNQAVPSAMKYIAAAGAALSAGAAGRAGRARAGPRPVGQADCLAGEWNRQPSQVRPLNCEVADFTG